MLVKNYKREEMDQMKDLPNIKIPFFNEGQLCLTDRDTVVKRISNLNGNYFSNKLYTIHSLENKRNVINMEELALPTNLVSINKEVVGYEMPYIHGVTLDDYLKDESVDVKDKIKALQNAGDILRKMQKVRDTGAIDDFFLNDLHEKNFIVTPEGQLKVVDLDSCSISSNLKFGTKYVSSMTPVKYYPKYERITTRSCGAEFIPSVETDLYCYNIMILNFLSGDRMHLYSAENYMEYLNYLEQIGANKELLDNLSRVYSDRPNVNVDYLLESIEEIHGKSRCRSK